MVEIFSWGWWRGITTGGEIAWGGRGIEEGGRLVVPTNRQTWYLRGESQSGRDASSVSDNDRAAVGSFYELVTELLPYIQGEYFARARAQGELSPGDCNEAVLYETWWLKATAGRQGSDDYVHLSITAKPLPDIPIFPALSEEDERLCREDPASYTSPTTYLVWNNEERPKTGSRVVLDEGRGPGTIIGWAAEYGWLYMMVWLDNERDWYGGRTRLSAAPGIQWSHENKSKDVA